MVSMYKRIEKKGLCPRDLSNQVGIYNRSLGATTPDKSVANVEFTLLATFMCGIQTITAVQREFSKNPNSKTTHLFFFQFSSRLSKLEPFKTYIKFRDEWYRLMSVDNMNEQNRVLVFSATVRGDTDEKESEA